MKSALLLVCGLALLESFSHGSIDLSDNDGVVGVSQKNLKEYMIKVLNGFKKVMLNGDEELNYPIMDPYRLQDVSWDYTDTSSSNKYNLVFINKNTTVINGLSNYEIQDVKVNAKNMKLWFYLTFTDLQAEIPYKLDGYFFKSIIPVYGEGLLKLFSPKQRFYITIDLDTEKGYILVSDLQILRYSLNADIQITGLMDLSDKFASCVLNDILDRNLKEHFQEALNKFSRDLIEETIGGMTTDELFDFLDHFEKKN